MQPKQPKAETQAMSEYGEPWKEDGCCAWADNGEGVRVADCWTRGKATCDRVVACVNALAGIPNPEAVREVLNAAIAYCSPTKSGHPYAACDEKLDRLAVLKSAVESLSAPSASPQQK